MSIQMTKQSVKSKLWKELTALIYKGRELTFVDGVWSVNTKDNEYFLNYIELINTNNYIKEINEYSHYMNNKLMERMTTKEIQAEINKVKQMISKYEKMNPWQRKVLAISNRINHCHDLINKYETKLLGIKEIDKRQLYIDVIKQCKKTIKIFENILVQESA